MNSKDRNLLMEGLRDHRGSVAEATRRTANIKEGGYTRQYVEQVLRGRYNNDEVLLICAQVLGEYQKRRDLLDAQLKKQISLVSEAVA